MSNLHSKTSTPSREQRRHSADFTKAVSILPRIYRHNLLTGRPTGTWRRVRQTSIPESQEVARWVRNLTTAPPSHNSDHPDSPPPKRPFVPSLDQFQVSRKSRDDEIERLLRPKKTPLPPHLPPEDEAYVDAILTKRGAVSKTGREQVADKDIARLRPHQWLNDEIINFYGQLMLSRSESQKESSLPIPAGGRINGLVNGINGKAKAKAVEKKPLLNVHYFNTFFWPKLTKEGYDKGRLAKWTKKVPFHPDPTAHRVCSSLVSRSSTCSQRM